MITMTSIYLIYLCSALNFLGIFLIFFCIMDILSEIEHKKHVPAFNLVGLFIAISLLVFVPDRKTASAMLIVPQIKQDKQQTIVYSKEKLEELRKSVNEWFDGLTD